MRVLHNDYLANLLNSSSRLNGNKPFWRYIKSRRQERIGISTLETPKGAVTSATSKAEALNKAFISVFTIEDLNSLLYISTRLYTSNYARHTHYRAWCAQHFITTI